MQLGNISIDWKGDNATITTQEGDVKKVYACQVQKTPEPEPPPPLPLGERVCFDAVAEADARTLYYKDIDPDASSEVLYETLSKLTNASHTKKLEYSEARWEHLYPWVDLRPDIKLHGVYGDAIFDAKKLIAQEKVTEATLNNKPAMALRSLLGVFGIESDKLQFNAEHAVPQSWFNKELPMRGDLHALFTADPGCNSMRSNYPFGTTSDNIVKQNSCGTVSEKSSEPRIFEPVPERGASKGAVARATLYFLVRYPDLINTPEMPKSRLKTLIKWHKENPPGLWEKHRNAEIAKIQGNRNPLIDYPGWVDRIDFLKGFGE